MMKWSYSIAEYLQFMEESLLMLAPLCVVVDPQRYDCLDLLLTFFVFLSVSILLFALHTPYPYCHSPFPSNLFYSVAVLCFLSVFFL